jgi:hypothetical protein
MQNVPANSQETPEPTVGVLMRDLLLGSRVTATAQAVGRPVRMIRDVAKLAGTSFTRLVVDLGQPGFLEAAIEWRKASEGRVVYGFVSHIDQETIRKAREGGIDHVLAKGAMAAALPEILA